MLNGFLNLWSFRGYIFGSVIRDFYSRYTGSVLGAALIFIVPIFQISLYVLVFGSVFRGRLPGDQSLYSYSIYLCCGILLWSFFSELLQKNQNVFCDNSQLIKKASFPNFILYLINSGVSLVNLLLASAVFFVFLFVVDGLPGWEGLLLLLVVFSILLLALAIGFCLSILQVFFRDFATLTAIGLQLLFWATPIVYPVHILPEWVRSWIWINPLYAPVVMAQSIFLHLSFPPFYFWYSTFGVILFFLFFSFRLYRRCWSDLLDSI